ncbi:hypothetical protein ABPG74_018527 [Tetrahymena malaccensis]
MFKLPSITNLKTESSDEKPPKIYSNKQSLLDIKMFLQDRNILTPRESSNSIQNVIYYSILFSIKYYKHKNGFNNEQIISDQLSKANNSSKATQQQKEFLPFTKERDALGRLLPKSVPVSSINSELELNFQGSLTSRQPHKHILGSHKSFQQFQHSNDILQQVKLAVEQDIIKRNKKKVNLVGQKLGDSLMKDITSQNMNNQNKQNYQFDKDSHFNIQVKKRMTPASRSNISLSSINELKIGSGQVERQILTPKGYLSSRGANDKSIMLSPPKYDQSHHHHHQSQSPHKALINTKRKASQPGIGHYNIWNKEKFTLKKTPNIILQDRNDMAEQEKLKEKKRQENIEKRKIYQYFQMQKQKEIQKFIESFTPQQEVKIVFPKIKENNKYQQEEQKQWQSIEKLQMKELNEEANFPIQFTEKLNDLKIKAKKIREAIILWNDQNPYKINKQQENQNDQVYRSSQIIETQGSSEM